ncbi:MAG: hypothetical protein M3R72_06960, partial [Bacteroidota bacterium]|nr:hypothetical protein [Bacteroidota bacterium]
VLPGIQRAGDSRSGSTKVEIVPDLRPALEALSNILLGIDNQSPSDMITGHTIADVIANNEALKTFLFNKAYRFSAAAKSQPAEVTKRNITTMPNTSSEPQTVDVLRKQYEIAYGRTLTVHLIRNYLGQLASDGIVSISKGRISTSRTRVQNLYTLMDDNQ